MIDGIPNRPLYFIQKDIIDSCIIIGFHGDFHGWSESSKKSVGSPWFPEIGVQIIHFNGGFHVHYKPTILGIPMTMENPFFAHGFSHSSWIFTADLLSGECMRT